MSELVDGHRGVEQSSVFFAPYVLEYNFTSKISDVLPLERESGQRYKHTLRIQEHIFGP